MKRRLPRKDRSGLVADLADMIQVDGAAHQARRPNANHRNVTILEGIVKIERRGQASRVDALFDQLFEVLFDDRRLSVANQVHLGSIRIDTDDVVSEM